MVAVETVQIERLVTKRVITCKGNSIPVVRLALSRQMCLRRGGEKMATPEDVESFMQENFGCRAQESVYGIHLSTRSEVLNVQEVSVGALDSAMLDPRVFFAGALESGAVASIIVHNHPSGDPQPSAADDQLTEQMVSGATLLSLRILDHIIIGRGGRSYSYVAHGRMPRPPGRLAEFDYAPKHETKRASKSSK